MNDLEKILATDDKSKSAQALADEAEAKKKAEVEAAAKQKDEEALRKKEHLENLNRAIAQANEDLRKLRNEKKELKPGEDELPKINLEDPSAKSWDKHMDGKVDPMKAELQKEKEEIRTFALQEFLQDKPALAKNSDKVKELISTYEKIRTASERTKEGVVLDLNKAYAAVFHEELISAARKGRVEKAEQDTLLSDIAISRGATSYRDQKDTTDVPLSDEDKKILLRWGIDPQAWQEDKKKYPG